VSPDRAGIFQQLLNQAGIGGKAAMDDSAQQVPQNEAKPTTAADDNPYQAPQTAPKPTARRVYFSLLFIPGLLLAVVSALFGTCAIAQSLATGIDSAFWGMSAIIAFVLAVIAWAILSSAFKRSRRG
jgi:hypothetical protein